MTMLIPQGDAQFSGCGRYRYQLTRELGGDRPLVGIGLNPSVAAADTDDNTIRKDMHFTRAWGFGRFVKFNAYGYVSTDPDIMFDAKRAGVDIVGRDNDEIIRLGVEDARRRDGVIWVAWGGKIEPDRQAALAKLLGDNLWCIKANRDGTPIHELYQPNASVLVPWRCP